MKNFLLQTITPELRSTRGTCAASTIISTEIAGETTTDSPTPAALSRQGSRQIENVPVYAIDR